MKKIHFSLVSILLASTFVVAGGSIAPIVVEEPVIVEEVDSSAFYVGLGYGNYQEDFDHPLTNSTDLDLNTVLFQVGFKYNKYIALEGRYWLGVGDLSVTKAGSQDQDLSGDYSAWGIYAKPMYPIDNFNIYALLGYASSSLDADNGDYWDADGFSWGVGAEYAFTEQVSVFVDYVNLANKDDLEWNNNLAIDADISISTINFGLTYKF